MTDGRILIVDDGRDLRGVLENILELSGDRVATAGNGQEALNYLHASPPPAAILLDLTMPVMNGVTFLEQFRSGAHPAWAAIPIVVLSAVPEFVPLARFRCAAIVRKPVELDTLLAIADRYTPQSR